jgi:plastocyanin
MATVEVKIQGFQFVPETVVIAVGDSVKWTNLDGTGHTASRDDKPAFDTGTLRTNESKTIVFSESTGSEGIEYFCRPHQRMRGHVVVTLAGSSPAAYLPQESLRAQHGGNH